MSTHGKKKYFSAKNAQTGGILKAPQTLTPVAAVGGVMSAEGHKLASYLYGFFFSRETQTSFVNVRNKHEKEAKKKYTLRQTRARECSIQRIVCESCKM